MAHSEEGSTEPDVEKAVVVLHAKKETEVETPPVEQELLLAGDGEKKPGAKGPGSKAARPHTRLELRTHFVINWSLILFIPLPLLLALSREPPLHLLAAALAATTVVSYLHWKCVRYGGWRQGLDTFVSSSTVAMHIAFVYHDPVAPRSHVYAVWVSMAWSTMSYFVGWHRHLAGAVIQGMCCHLAFRYGAFWVLVFSLAGNLYAITGIIWLIITGSYIVTCYALWRVTALLIPPSLGQYESGEQRAGPRPRVAGASERELKLPEARI